MMTKPIGLVAGSGIDLRPLIDTVYREYPFHEFTELSTGAVPGHHYSFVVGEHAGFPVVLQCGRHHAYEGLSQDEVIRTVDILERFGVSAILFTNAVGGLLPAMQPGDLVAVHTVRPWPFLSYRLPETIPADIHVAGCEYSGDYAWMHGPTYETRSEIALLQAMNCACVGMSTAPELLHCRQRGIPAGIVSCITNSCCSQQTLTHDHVLAVARHASEKLRLLLSGAIKDLGAPQS